MEKIVPKKTISLLIAFFLIISISCGNEGESVSTNTQQTTYSDVLGSISTPSGNQGDLAGWVLVLIDTKQVARISEIWAETGVVSESAEVFGKMKIVRSYH